MAHIMPVAANIPAMAHRRTGASCKKVTVSYSLAPVSLAVSAAPQVRARGERLIVGASDMAKSKAKVRAGRARA